MLTMQGIYSDLFRPILVYLYLRNARIWLYVPWGQSVFFGTVCRAWSPLPFSALAPLLGAELIPCFLWAPPRVGFCSPAPPAVTCSNRSLLRLQPQAPRRSPCQNLSPSRCYSGCQVSVLVLSVLPPLARPIRIPNVPRWLASSHADPELLGQKKGGCQCRGWSGARASFLNMWSVEASLRPAVKMQIDVCHSVNTPRQGTDTSWADQHVPSVSPDWATSFLPSCSETGNFVFLAVWTFLHSHKTWWF